MNILENELVKKYFGIYHCEHLARLMREPGTLCEFCMSRNILQAMQEPINEGDLLLELGSRVEGYKNKTITATDSGYGVMHPYFLRLPDRFQAEKKECSHENMPPCGFCGAIPIYKHPSADPCTNHCWDTFFSHKDDEHCCWCGTTACPEPGCKAFGRCDAASKPEAAECEDAKLLMETHLARFHTAPNSSPPPADPVETSPQYVVQFSSHEDHHELEIDIECLWKALNEFENKKARSEGRR